MTHVFLPRRLFFRLLAAVGLLLVASFGEAAEYEILNASYDTSREFYKELNPAFVKFYKAQTADDVVVTQLHRGSAAQARAVIGGLNADVVTLAVARDIDGIAEKTHRLPKNWQSRFPHNSVPYTSTIVFVVRKGNLKNIRDWNDLIRPEVEVIVPNPKTSGGGRWSYLAAWAYGLEKFGSAAKTRAFVKQIFKNVPVLDARPRSSANTFVQHGIGDVFLAWENEAFRIVNEQDKGSFEIVTPSISILAEPSVAMVDAVVKKKGTEKVARAYLEYLYSKEGQRIIAKHYYRPSDPEVALEFAGLLPEVRLVNIDKVFGGWQEALSFHFDDGGEFDKIQAELRRRR